MKIKILYTIPNFNTAGSGIALMKLISRLDKSRFEPHIVCLHEKGDYFNSVVTKSGIPVHIFPYTHNPKPYLKGIRTILTFYQFVKKNKFDIVFSYHYYADYMEAFSAKLAGAKFIYVKKNMSWKGPSYRAWRLKSFLADNIFVQNTDMLKLFYKDNKKAKLISIGVDTSEFYPRDRDVELLKELKLSTSDKVILCVAHIVYKKGIDILIKAFENVSNSIEGVTLIIVGDDKTSLAIELREMVKKLRVKDIIFTGKRSDLTRFYSIADLFVLPSIGNEGAPIAIQEAMASSVIVITTDTPGNRDQLEEFPQQLVKPKDIESLANCIVKYIGISVEEKKEIVSQQIRIVEERYSLSVEVRNHEFIYAGYFE